MTLAILTDVLFVAAADIRRSILKLIKMMKLQEIITHACASSLNLPLSAVLMDMITWFLISLPWLCLRLLRNPAPMITSKVLEALRV
jgi:hypothetical protein